MTHIVVHLSEYTHGDKLGIRDLQAHRFLLNFWPNLGQILTELERYDEVQKPQWFA